MTDKTPDLLKELSVVLERYCAEKDTKIKVRDVLQTVEYTLKVKFIKKSVTIAEAARLLNINRTALCMYLKKVGLSKADIKAPFFEE